MGSGAERRGNVCFHAQVDDRGADGDIGSKIRESRETVRPSSLNYTEARRQCKGMDRRVAEMVVDQGLVRRARRKGRRVRRSRATRHR